MKKRRKIVVLRANGIGDFIFALPALQALRASFPEDEIIYLGKKLHQELLESRPSPIDRVIVVPPYAGVGEAENFPTNEALAEEFFAQMRQEKFDVAIQIHGGGRNSNPFLLRLGAALTLGLQTPGAAALDINVPYHLYFSEMLRYVEVVSYLGARPSELYPRFAVMPRDIEEARRAFPEIDRGPFAVLHPGATDSRRHWPAENFVAVANYLCGRSLTVCISGSGPHEGRIAEEVMAQVKHPRVVNLSNRLPLRGLVGLLARASLMVSNDSGPLHLGNAIGTPNVGIYLACNMINAMPMGVSHCRPQVSWITRCPLCGASLHELQGRLGQCAHEVSFAAGVSVPQVIEAIEDLDRHIVRATEGACMLAGN